MDNETFVNRLTGPLYVWRMARGVAYPFGPQEEARTPLQRSGRTRMANAQRAMDDLVLARAEVIRNERGEVAPPVLMPSYMREREQDLGE